MWQLVGWCHGVLNTDNMSIVGITLDYGPFGFCDVFNPNYQPWTGGGQHFALLNQPMAAELNFHMFCTTLVPLLASNQPCLRQLIEIRNGFSTVMQAEMEQMWAAKLGLSTFHSALFSELQTLMMKTPVDYTIFFRELSNVPEDIGPLKKSFYQNSGHGPAPEGMDKDWAAWLEKWKSLIGSASATDPNAASPRSREELSTQMKIVNPKYSLREWFLVDGYEQAGLGNYAPLRELQEVMTQPYAEQSKDMETKYYRLKPSEFFEVGGLSYMSCSS